MRNNQLHIDFKLNGISFSSVEELLVYSKTLSYSTHNFLIEWFSADAVVYVSTSGSTGTPKLIKLKKEFIRNSALATGAFFELPAKTTALLCMSTDYIAGKMMLVRAIVLGWHLDVVAVVSNPLKGLGKQYNFSAMVPMQLQNSLSEIDMVEKLIVGGGIVSKELESQIQAVSTEVFATFGMTETITHIAVKKLNHLSSRVLANGLNNYQTLPNIFISQDQRGCLVIDAPMVSEELLITNDVVALISEKEFKWLGRFDTVINSGGVKLHPEEIEKKIAAVLTQRFFVAGAADDKLGEKLILVVEANVVSSQDEKDLKEKLKHLLLHATNLTKYEQPKSIFVVAGFVETETKKIQRNKTLELLFKS